MFAPIQTFFVLPANILSEDEIIFNDVPTCGAAHNLRM